MTDLTYYMAPMHPEGKYWAKIRSAEAKKVKDTVYISLKLDTMGDRPNVFLDLFASTRYSWEPELRTWLAGQSIDPWPMTETDATVIAAKLASAKASLTITVENVVGKDNTLWPRVSLVEE